MPPPHFGSELELIFPRQSEPLAIDRQVQKGLEEKKKTWNIQESMLRHSPGEKARQESKEKEEVLARYLMRRLAAPAASKKITRSVGSWATQPMERQATVLPLARLSCPLRRRDGPVPDARLRHAACAHQKP